MLEPKESTARIFKIWFFPEESKMCLAARIFANQTVSEFSGWLAVAHSNASSMAAAFSTNDEVNSEVTPVEDCRIGRVATSHDYSCATIRGSQCGRAVSVDCRLFKFKFKLSHLGRLYWANRWPHRTISLCLTGHPRSALVDVFKKTYACAPQLLCFGVEMCCGAGGFLEQIGTLSGLLRSERFQIFKHFSPSTVVDMFVEYTRFYRIKG